MICVVVSGKRGKAGYQQCWNGKQLIKVWVEFSTSVWIENLFHGDLLDTSVNTTHTSLPVICSDQQCHPQVNTVKALWLYLIPGQISQDLQPTNGWVVVGSMILFSNLICLGKINGLFNNLHKKRRKSHLFTKNHKI